MQELADKVWGNPKFHDAAHRIELAWLTKEIGGVDDGPADITDATRLMRSAAIIALADAGWHAVQHLSFLLSALLFWTAMLRGHDHARRGVAILCLFATSMISGALGALMALSASPWYKGYADLGMAPFGLTPAEDQQIAGLLMWVPGGMVHAAAALMLMRSVLRGSLPKEITYAG